MGGTAVRVERIVAQLGGSQWLARNLQTIHLREMAEGLLGKYRGSVVVSWYGFQKLATARGLRCRAAIPKTPIAQKAQDLRVVMPWTG